MSVRFMKHLRAASLLLAIAPLIAWGQLGDRPGEAQRDLPAELQVPAAPVLSDEAALASFTLQPGYRIELVASHPRLFDPVAMEIGPDGRIWVVEMRGYMHDTEGAGEELPIGTVAVLDDEDGDGFYEHRTEFAGGLVMPRALSLAADGVVVGAPPYLYHFKDTDGDGVADERTVLAEDYGIPGNPEHTANALYRALDNWIYSADHNVRHRYARGAWEREYTTPRGQWGMDQDNWGRLYYNSNSDPLRVDLTASHYFWRHPGQDSTAPLAVQTARSRDVPTFPGRITPGINRGYQILDETWTLKTVTAACGPMIYRGTRFPDEFRGNAFICEPSANLVKRVVVSPTDNGSLQARNAYPDSEFITSTDERFRPVNAYNGPDGAIYLLDFYRGIIQHKIYMTTYLKKQVVQRGLDAPLGRGRIWKIVPVTAADDWRDTGRPQLHEASPRQLVAALNHPNGWWRDTAQRLLVERGSMDAVAHLQEMAESGNALGRLHALWTLAGLNKISRPVAIAALADEDPGVRIAAMQMSEPWLRLGDREIVSAVRASARDKNPNLVRQAVLSLGELGGAEGIRALAEATEQVAAVHGLADAIKSGIAGREREIAATLLDRKTSPVAVFADEMIAADQASRVPPAVLEGPDLTPTVRPLSETEQLLFEAGQSTFALCSGCHQPDGRGLPGLAPSLVDSTFVEADPRLVARVILHGKEGYDWQMPGLGPALDDEAVAGVLTFVRRSFGHTADPVTPETVAAVRATESARARPWTNTDLDRLVLE